MVAGERLPVSRTFCDISNKRRFGLPEDARERARQLAERSNVDEQRVAAIVLGRWTPSPQERDRIAPQAWQGCKHRGGKRIGIRALSNLGMLRRLCILFLRLPLFGKSQDHLSQPPPVHPNQP